MKQATKALWLGLVALAIANGFAHADNIFTSLWSGQVKEIDSSGNVSVFANRGQFWYGPYGIALGPDGYLYVAETSRGAIIKLDSTAHEFAFASGLNSPIALAFDGSGNLYVANSGDATIRKFDSSGHGSFFAPGVGPTGLILSLACDRSGNVYESTSAGTIQRYDSSGNATVFATNLPNAWGLAFDSSGYLYVGNGNYNDGTIWKFDSSGNRSVFASGLVNATGLAFGSNDALYEVNVNGTIMKFDSRGNGVVFASGVGETMGITVQIPEPATWSLLVMGMFALLGGLRLYERTGFLGSSRVPFVSQATWVTTRAKPFV